MSVEAQAAMFSGATLKKMRKKADFSTNKLAWEMSKLMNRPVSPEGISGWEDRGVTPSGNFVAALAAVFKVKMETFFEKGARP